MANSDLTAQELRGILVYNEETGEFFWRLKPHLRWKEIGSNATGGYRRITIRKTTYLAHRLAWLYVYGEWPKNAIDHRDGNPKNNAIKNLRDVPHQVNAQNAWRAKSNNASGLLGASWNAKAKKWHAAIRTGQLREFIGAFDSADEAHRAYIERKLLRHGLP